MILFKPEHIEKIQNGIKTQTRKRIGRTFKVGSVHQIKTGFMKKDFHGYIRITSCRTESLGNITLADAHAEGYESIEEYKKVFCRIYQCSWDDVVPVQVIDFEYLGMEIT